MRRGLILGRLLAWAMRSQTPTAKKILQMANRGEWEAGKVENGEVWWG